MDGLREQAALPSQVDQATVLEHALALIKQLKEQLATASTTAGPSAKRAAYDSCSFIGQPQSSSSASSVSDQPLDSVHVATTHNHLELTDFEMDVGSFMVQLPSISLATTAATSTWAAPPQLALTSLPDVNVPTPPYTVSLDSMFLPLSVALVIFNNAGHILDCNQATLTLGGATSIDEYNNHRNWRESKLIVEMDVDVAAFEQLQRAGSVSTHQLSRKLDGTVHWSRTLATRMGDSAKPINAESTYFGVYQPASAPADGRSRVWTSEHLVHVGLRQHQRQHTAMDSMVEVL